ncbi:MAG: hypothetical protein ACNA7U_03615 [Candidatus Izemoplasmataceae bacterium]
MDNYKGNSNAGKKPVEREKIETVTKNVSIKKESELKKFKKNFFAEDSKTVKGQVFMDVIVPGIQRLFTDSIKTWVDVLVYGSRRNNKDTRGGNVSYASYYDRNKGPEYNKIPQATYNKNAFSFNDVVLFDRGEAENVLMSLREQLNKYGMVSVGDFYDSIGQSAPYTANNFGWRDLDDVGIDRVRNGYSINFPKATPLV